MAGITNISPQCLEINNKIESVILRQIMSFNYLPDLVFSFTSHVIVHHITNFLVVFSKLPVGKMSSAH